MNATVSLTDYTTRRNTKNSVTSQSNYSSPVQSQINSNNQFRHSTQANKNNVLRETIISYSPDIQKSNLEVANFSEGNKPVRRGKSIKDTIAETREKGTPASKE